MNTDELTIERQRFAAVMKARRNDKELLGLFPKLALSDLFLEEAKPYCCADLIAEASRRLADKNVPLLMETVEQQSAAKKVRAGIPADQADVVMRVLMKRVFNSSPMQSAPLMQVFMWSERTQVGADRGHTICLGLEGGIAQTVMDDICDLTFYEYYPSIARRALPPRELLAA